MIRRKPMPAASSTLELTPLIDIVFIVVVFLLLTANTQLLPLPVNIPQADGDTATQQDTITPITVSVFADTPAFAIDRQRYADWPAFKTALLPLLDNSERPIAIAADRDAAVEPLLQLLALLNARQIQNTRILMEGPHHD